MIIYNTEECGYFEGLDRLVQLYPEIPEERQRRLDQIGDYVDNTRLLNKGRTQGTQGEPYPSWRVSLQVEMTLFYPLTHTP